MALDDTTAEHTTTPAPSTGNEPVSDAAAKEPHADPSSAQDDSKKSLLDAVRSAIDVKNIEDDDAPASSKQPTAKAESSPAEGEKSKPDADSKANGKDDVSDDALLATLDQLKDGSIPLNKIERFREVLSENRRLARANENYKQLDQTFTDIGNDARRVGLDTDELAQLFSWPRLLASDPATAVEQLQAFAAKWQERVGHTLPADLKQKVADGYMDEASAKEVAQLRATRELDATRRKADQADQERSTRERQQGEIRTAVDAYQAELKTSDPDYTPEKHALTVDALTALVMQRGVPTTVEGARAMAKEAYDTVTKRLSAFKPQPRPIASPTAGRHFNKPAESQPKTMREAVMQALGE